MLALIGEVIIWVREAWVAIKEVRLIGRIAKGIACAVQWYAWLQQIKIAINFLESISIPKAEIYELLGLGFLNLGETTDEVEDNIKNNLDQVTETLKQSGYFDREIDATPSAWNGVHRPNYHSIAISEVLYEYSNEAGTGTMIIMFNPEGFGYKPKVPQIVRYVDEWEIAEFTSSKSWGLYWRDNFIKGGRYKNRSRRRNKYSKNNDNMYEQMPASEDLDKYLERVLNVDEEYDDLIAGEFKDLILEGMDKSIYQSDMMSRAIEYGDIGRGLEKNGMRVTSLIQDKIKEVPSHLKKIVAKNPIYRDVAKVSRTYKKYVSKMRSLRDRFNSASYLSSFSDIKAATFANLGAIQKLQLEVGLTTDFKVKIAEDLSLESSVISKEYLEAIGDINNAKFRHKKLVEEINSRKKGLNLNPDEFGVLASEEELILLESEGIVLKDIIETFKKNKKSLISNGSVGKLAKGIIKPPTCIPFIKSKK